MRNVFSETQHVLSERAHPHYSDELAYHNWNHAVDVMLGAAALAGRSHNPEIIENSQLLVIAAAWHDADYHIEPLGKFTTKEERSAELAVRSLPELSRQKRDLLYSGIIDTTVAKTEKDNLFGEALHLADIGYFAADNNHFMQRLELMRAEWGNPEWGVTVERTRAFGSQVIFEAHKPIFEILPEPQAAAWLLNIHSNLEYLQRQLDEGELV